MLQGLTSPSHMTLELDVLVLVQASRPLQRLLSTCAGSTTSAMPSMVSGQAGIGTIVAADLCVVQVASERLHASSEFWQGRCCSGRPFFQH